MKKAYEIYEILPKEQVYIMWVQELKEKDKMIESIFKEMGWNFRNLRKDVHMQIHEVQRPRKSDPKKIMPGHIIINLLNI